ncbi:MAG: Yip1 family protein [Vicinamibacterales bacterium]
MNLTERVKNICISPNSEWPVIEQESTPPAELATGYLAPLAAIGAVANFVGGSIIGTTLPFVGTYRQPIAGGVVSAVFMFVLTIAFCFLLGFIINALAPTFGGRQDSNQAFKVAVYSYTPGLLAGALRVLPALGALVGLIAGLYGLYLLYLGLPQLMKAPRDKAVGYTIVIVVCAVVAGVILGIVSAAFAGAGMMMNR